MDKKGFRSARILGLPNLLTASRIAAAPVLAWAVLMAQTPELALAIVIGAALTDLLDGLCARATGQMSELGEVLDPVADKIFVLTALWLLWGEGVIQGYSGWAALIILWRELLISGLRNYARFKGLGASVSAVAKLKTAAQFCALVMLFASRANASNAWLMHRGGSGLLWLSAALALYTGGEYFLRAWRGSWK